MKIGMKIRQETETRAQFHWNELWTLIFTLNWGYLVDYTKFWLGGNIEVVVQSKRVIDLFLFQFLWTMAWNWILMNFLVRSKSYGTFWIDLAWDLEGKSEYAVRKQRGRLHLTCLVAFWTPLLFFGRHGRVHKKLPRASKFSYSSFMFLDSVTKK